MQKKGSKIKAKQGRSKNRLVSSKPRKVLLAQRSAAPAPSVLDMKVKRKAVEVSRIRLISSILRPMISEKFPARWTKIFSAVKMTALTCVIVLVALPLFSAFEAHIVNISAEIIRIDPPVVTPPGDIGWYVLNGGMGLTGEVKVDFSSDDPDATHIFYTFGEGTDPAVVPDPACGQAPGAGAGGGLIETEILSLSLTSDTVVKAISCDGGDGFAHKSLTNTKIFSFCVDAPVAFPQGLAVFAAGAATATDDVRIASGTLVSASVRSNHDIRAEGTGSNRVISGDATASGNLVNPANFNIAGSIATGTSPALLPDLNLPFWENRAASGGRVDGHFILPANLSGTVSMGPSEIEKNLSIGANDTVEITGPLYIKGNLSIASGARINAHASFFDVFVPIMVEGTIDIADDVVFSGAGPNGAFLLVSKAAALSGASSAIDLSAGSGDAGDALLFALNGEINVRDGRTLLAAFAKTGFESDNPAVRLQNNITVAFRPLPEAIGCGASFVPPASLVINEFIPNPAGLDNAAKPDGEWVELFNGTNADIDASSMVLYDSDDTHALPVTTANTDTGGTIIPAHGYLVVYRNGDGDFELNNTADSVRLYSKAMADGGLLVDSNIYDYGSPAPDDKSFSRSPDGSASWIDPDPTPGQPNQSFVSEDDTSEPLEFLDEEEALVEEPETEEPVVPGTEAAPNVESDDADSTQEPAAQEHGGNGTAPEIADMQENESSTTTESVLEEGNSDSPTSTPSVADESNSEPQDPADSTETDLTEAPAEEGQTVEADEPQPEAVLPEEDVAEASAEEEVSDIPNEVPPAAEEPAPAADMVSSPETSPAEE